LSVELAVDYLFPGAEIEITVGNGDDNFPAHDLTLQVCIAVVLARTVMAIPGDGFVGSKPFKPVFIILMEAPFVIVDENLCRDVHGIDQHQPFLDPAFDQAGLDLRCNVEKGPPVRKIEPKFLTIGFHILLLLLDRYASEPIILITQAACHGKKGA
jgi:hypothetical protein